MNSIRVPSGHDPELQMMWTLRQRWLPAYKADNDRQGSEDW